MDEEYIKIADKLTSIDKTLTAQHATLKEHIRRTELLEKQIQPLQEHVTKVKVLVNVFAWIIGIFIAAITAWWTRR